MRDYIVIVRACAKNHIPDETLYALDLIFKSPVIKMDYEKDRCKALDEFDAKYGKNYSRFLNIHYELIPV